VLALCTVLFAQLWYPLVLLSALHECSTSFDDPRLSAVWPAMIACWLAFSSAYHALWMRDDILPSLARRMQSSKQQR
jgi:hypothetical protein